MVNRFVVLLLVLTATACSHKSDSEDTPAGEAETPVEVAPVKRGEMVSYISAEAVLYPLRQATIIPKISAPVQRFVVQRGDHVRSGQLLAVLEDRDLTAAAQESRELYGQAQATYDNLQSAQMPDDLIKAKTDVQTAQESMDATSRVYESRLKLYKEGALAEKLVEDAKVAMVQSRSTLDTAQQHLKSIQTVGQSAQLRGARAQVEAADAHYKSAEAQLSYTRIQSPVAGIVSDRPLNVGEMASSGSPLLTVVDISTVVARANLPVDTASQIRLGQTGMITAGEVELPGKVTVVSPAVDPNTTTVQVWMQASNPGEQVKLGTSVHIQIRADQLKNALIVPAVALLPNEEGGERVMVAGQDSLAHSRPVKVGTRNTEEAQILSGLNGTERVIVAGAVGLDDKAKITVDQK
jgi:HlyD family secretion protein